MLRAVRSSTVLSFMSEWGGSHSHRRGTSSATPSPAPPSPSKQPNASSFSVSSVYDSQDVSQSPQTQPRPDSRPSSRPMSMIQTYQPPVMEVGQDTLPELQRIFTFLNSHSNKLYQEGYFLKFHDTDARTSLLPYIPACDTDSCRRPPSPRPRLARVLRPARGHHPVAVGRQRAGPRQWW